MTPNHGDDAPIPLISLDPYLAPHADALRERRRRYQAARAEIERNGGLLGPITQGYDYFGFNRGENDGAEGVWYREWAPGARAVSLIGDFNQWDRSRTPLARDEWGVWQAFVPDGQDGVAHGERVKAHVVGADGVATDRIPAYARRVVQEGDHGPFVAQAWLPPSPYAFNHPAPMLPAGEGLRIYEAHTGMAQEAGRVGTYQEFADNILPRIARAGYNAIQLMAVMEHPYYGSFGYHVSSFYAASSRFGTPEDLKRLVDTAHGLGLQVLLDIVHSHAVKNTLEGLNRFDGTDFQYFHAGAKGNHPAWDSMVFDYSRYEVRRFLLSNVRFWLEEFRFDGLRFDGVTSMLYHDHGLHREFISYDDYFGSDVDEEAVLYLQLAADVARAVKPDAVLIAEDVSGMPGLARPVSEGGVGFDYRLAMGVPDFWIALIKEKREEDWRLGEIYAALLNRRWTEKHVGYVESHDQSLVGDKTLAFQLMDAAMYTDMGKDSPSLVVERGVALHKIIRLLTFSLAGDAYLNFIGNEWGHPEWVDFPRDGNNYSYQNARRQWSLADDPGLRYEGLGAFDCELQRLDTRFHLLCDPLIEQLALHEDTRQLIYRRGPLVFAVNLHPAESYADLRIPIPDREDYRLVLNTDDVQFAGPGRGEPSGTGTYPVQTVPMYGREQSLQIYLPSRSAQVLAPASLLIGRQ